MDSQRLWSFSKPVVKNDTTKFKANVFGFYAINGERVVALKENSKKSLCEFLEEVRKEHPDKTIIIILDNFRSN